jgi:hypothetical protein
METRLGAGESPVHHDDGDTSQTIQIDAPTLARVIREQQAIPLTDEEANTLAQTLEAAKDDGELLANAVSAVRFLLARLELAILADELPLDPEP